MYRFNPEYNNKNINYAYDLRKSLFTTIVNSTSNRFFEKLFQIITMII